MWKGFHVEGLPWLGRWLRQPPHRAAGVGILERMVPLRVLVLSVSSYLGQCMFRSQASLMTQVHKGSTGPAALVTSDAVRSRRREECQAPAASPNFMIPAAGRAGPADPSLRPPCWRGWFLRLVTLSVHAPAGGCRS